MIWMLEDKFKDLPLSTKMLIIISMGNTFNRVFYKSMKVHQYKLIYLLLTMYMLSLSVTV